MPSSSSTPGTSTPKGRKQSNASSSNGRLSKASTVTAATTTTTANNNSSTRSNAASRYEEYLPLCEMQKGLEKGEIVEVSSRTLFFV